MKIAKIALNLPLFKTFDYLIDENITLIKGMRVVVPFGNTQKVGIFIEYTKQSAFSNLKKISKVLDDDSIFSVDLLAMLDFTSNYYHQSLGETYFLALPKKLRDEEIAKLDNISYFNVSQKGIEASKNQSIKRSKKQQNMLDELCLQKEPFTNDNLQKNIFKALVEKEFIIETNETTPLKTWFENKNSDIVNSSNKHFLTKEQSLSVSQIDHAKGFNTFLLNGVTGSGKTEVYLQAIETQLKKHKQVLVLVPEIGLTPQTLKRFENRFNVPIIALHSNISDKTRFESYIKIKQEQVALVIGTRSAIFAPFNNLGLIIVDEEHDSSFKQLDSIRYNGRDLAIWRAFYNKIPIVLGSATPSLESFYHSQSGKYQELILNERAGKSQKCKFGIIDLKSEQGSHPISTILKQEMKIELEKGNQVLLFLNRRGFAPVLFCNECGFIFECIDCNKPFTFHKQKKHLHCHHCSAFKAIPKSCSHCGSTLLKTTGYGTEQLEDSLKKDFTNYNIVRIDRDSTSKKGSLEQKLSDITNKKAQILIGTQMLAKGHHFPDVTLVAILNVDQALFSRDFRAEEKFAQLFTQVAGRAGRGRELGKVLLQTNFPEHKVIQTLTKQDYRTFALNHLEERSLFNLPPFSYQVLFKASSKNTQKAFGFLIQIQQVINQIRQKLNDNELIISEIEEAPMAKKANRFYAHLTISHINRTKLQKILTTFDIQREQISISGDLRFTIDVDPQDFS